MAAMPLPLQLKSWKGRIAGMAQSKFRVSVLRRMDFQGEKRGMGLAILMIDIPFGRSPSFIAAAYANMCRDIHELCSCSTRSCAVKFCTILLVVIYRSS